MRKGSAVAKFVLLRKLTAAVAEQQGVRGVNRPAGCWLESSWFACVFSSELMAPRW